MKQTLGIPLGHYPTEDTRNHVALVIVRPSEMKQVLHHAVCVEVPAYHSIQRAVDGSGVQRVVREATSWIEHAMRLSASTRKTRDMLKNLDRPDAIEPVVQACGKGEARRVGVHECDLASNERTEHLPRVQKVRADEIDDDYANVWSRHGKPAPVPTPASTHVDDERASGHVGQESINFVVHHWDGVITADLSEVVGVLSHSDILTEYALR